MKQINFEDVVLEKVVIEGYKGPDGRTFYPASPHVPAADVERMAKKDACTHILCPVCKKNHTEKHHLRCEECQAKKDRADWLALPEEEWDGETPLVLFRSDRYFFDWEDVDMFSEDEDVPVRDMMLVKCEPLHAPELDIGDFLESVLPGEDGDIPEELELAAEAFNSTVKKYNETKSISWWPGKIRIRYEAEKEKGLGK